jgi:hypothetical protein
VTKFFSRGTPNLAKVIPAMDRIHNSFLSWKADPKLPECIRAAVSLGAKTLNHYYSRTDWSELYRIAMGTYFFLFLSNALN